MTEVNMMKDGGGLSIDTGGETEYRQPDRPSLSDKDDSYAENEKKAWYHRDSLHAYVRADDFKEIVSCVVFFIIMMIIYFINPTPRQRPIPFQYLQTSGEYVMNLVNDSPVKHPETISSPLLVVLAEILPVITQLILAKKWGVKGDAHNTICVYLVSLGLMLFSVECIKLYVGYLRPGFFEVCQPNSNFTACTQPSNEVRVSFPSGHASTSFCGLMLLTVYIHNRFGIPSVKVMVPQDVVGDNGTTQRRLVLSYTSASPVPTRYRFSSILALLPLVLATFISASRVADNKHFPADVVGGAVLGAAISLFVNGLWYDFTPTVIMKGE